MHHASAACRPQFGTRHDRARLSPNKVTRFLILIHLDHLCYRFLTACPSIQSEGLAINIVVAIVNNARLAMTFFMYFRVYNLQASK